MSTSVVGAVRVNLGLDSAAFDKGLRDARSALAAFGSKLKTGLIAAGASFAAFGTATALGLHRVQEEIDKLYKLSQSIGVPVDELAKLAHAADLSGVSVDGLATGIKKFSKELSEMATNTTGAAARALRAMGLSATDASGRLKPMSQLLDEIADRFKNYADGSNKTALAMALFGRSGADLIPLLNGGSKALREMKDEAAALGLVFSGDAARATEAFNDNVTKLKKAWDGFLVQLNEELIPSLLALSNQLVSVVKEGDRVKTWAQSVAQAFSDAAVAAHQWYTGIAFTRMATAGFWDWIWSTPDDWKVKKQKMLDEMNDVLKTFFIFKQNMENAPTTAKLKGTIDPFETLTEGAKKAAPALDAATDKVKEFSRALLEKGDKMRLEVQLLGATEEAQTFANEKLALENLLRKENIRLSPLRQAQMLAEIDALARQAQATEDARARYERFRENVDAFRNAYSSAIDKMLEGTFKFKDAIRDLLKSLIKLWTNQLFVQMFGGGSRPGSFNLAGLFGFGGGGGVFAGGLNNNGKASGGPVAAGQMYMVGERGRELFVPDVAGQIVPNHTLKNMGPAGGGAVMNNYINATGADPAGLARVERAVGDLNRNFEKRFASAQYRRDVRGVRPQ